MRLGFNTSLSETYGMNTHETWYLSSGLALRWLLPWAPPFAEYWQRVVEDICVPGPQRYILTVCSCGRSRATKKCRRYQQFVSKYLHNLRSCHTIGTCIRLGTPTPSRFSCRRRISSCSANCPPSSDARASRMKAPSQADMSHSPYNRPLRNLDTLCVQSSHKLEHKNHTVYVY